MLNTINELYGGGSGGKCIPLNDICTYRFKNINTEIEFIQNVLIKSKIPFDEIYKIYHRETIEEHKQPPIAIYHLMNSQKESSIEKLIHYQHNIKKYLPLCHSDNQLKNQFKELDQYITHNR